MDVKVQTSRYEIVNSGIVFLEDEFLEFVIDGLIFRLFISPAPKEGNTRTNPFVNCSRETIDGVEVMCVRAYNWGGPTTITLTRPVYLANVGGQKLLFRFSSSETKNQIEKTYYNVHYSWFLEKKE